MRKRASRFLLLTQKWEQEADIHICSTTQWGGNGSRPLSKRDLTQGKTGGGGESILYSLILLELLGANRVTQQFLSSWRRELRRLPAKVLS